MILLDQNQSTKNTPPLNMEDLQIRDITPTVIYEDSLSYAIRICFAPYIKIIDFIYGTYTKIRKTIISFCCHRQ